jgi:uncharacterized membrane protein YdjX (TVP38/TMEM64 family)
MEIFSLLGTRDIELVVSFLASYLLITLFLTMVLMIIQNAFTTIPLLLLITINTSIFGFIYGFIWSWLTSVVAAGIVFFSVRYWFQDFFRRKLKGKYNSDVGNRGFMYVFIGRVFPFVPTSLVNIAAGVGSVKFTQFLVGTMVGNFIYFFILALVPYGLFTSNLDVKVLLIIALIAILLYLIYKFLLKDHLNRWKWITPTILSDKKKEKDF